VKRYGFKCPTQNKEVRKKIRETNLKKYGQKVPLSSPEIHKLTTTSA
jgi:hypothetical protein